HRTSRSTSGSWTPTRSGRPRFTVPMRRSSRGCRPRCEPGRVAALPLRGRDATIGAPMAHRPEATEQELRPEEIELRHRPGVERAYFGDDFVVTWEPALCVHSARCFRSLPRVFRPWERPWVHVDEATEEEIEAV